MVQGRWFPTGADITEALTLRQQVFDRGQDAKDAMAQQVVVYDNAMPVGAARLWWQNGAFWLGDVGVLPQERGHGYGDLLVRLLLFKALTHSAEHISLRTPLQTQGFFAQYGFTPVEGADPVTMTILAKDVQLSHCGGHCERCENRTPECTPKALR